MDLHRAIASLYENVGSIEGNTQKDIVAKDLDGNNIEINWDNVNSWSDPADYKLKRQFEYPSIGEQLDMIFRAGLGGDEFQEAIQAIKDKYPKSN